MKGLAILLALAFFVIAALYWTGTLQIAVRDPGLPHHKHAVLFAGLGILCLIWFRFQSASPTTRAR